ncbi:hypothetical protein E4T56_gene12803 [Termitomyces sp. T112]|nr:hypothetical protein E4T56_gene12803 [Termitomyces sp. T112]
MISVNADSKGREHFRRLLRNRRIPRHPPCTLTSDLGRRRHGAIVVAEVMTMLTRCAAPSHSHFHPPQHRVCSQFHFSFSFSFCSHYSARRLNINHG